MQQAIEKAESRLLFAHDFYRKCSTNNCVTPWKEERTTCSMDQAVLDLYNYFKEKCSNDLAKVPFLKGSTLFRTEGYYERSTIMRDYIIDKDPWTLHYVPTTFPHLFKFISGIENLVKNNFDLESGETLRSDCSNIREQYFEFVEKYLESRNVPFEKHRPISNDKIPISDLKPFLFCRKMSFLIVNLDECEFECNDKNEYLNYLLITQSTITLLAGNTLCMSYFFSGNSISVFFGEIADIPQDFVQDLMDLALEFFLYQNISAKDSYFRPSNYELVKQEYLNPKIRHSIYETRLELLCH